MWGGERRNKTDEIKIDILQCYIIKIKVVEKKITNQPVITEKEISYPLRKYKQNTKKFLVKNRVEIPKKIQETDMIQETMFDIILSYYYTFKTGISGYNHI